VQGRADDVLKTAGHRISNSEIESAMVSHPHVAEAVAIGKPHPIKGEAICVYVVLREGIVATDRLRTQLMQHVSNEIGKIARPDEVWFVTDVPKTRSGKIMRRIVRAKAIGEAPGDVSTLRNPEAVEALEHAT
jgi:acetyl-CoA synthetase